MSSIGAGRFADKVALLTGASSASVARTAVQLAAEGARVLAVDVNAEGLAALGGRGRAAWRELVDVWPASPTVTAAPPRCAVHRLVRAPRRPGQHRRGLARAEHFAQLDDSHYRQMFAVKRRRSLLHVPGGPAASARVARATSSTSRRTRA